MTDDKKKEEAKEAVTLVTDSNGLKKFYESLEPDQQIIQFLINCLVCSSNGIIDEKSANFFIFLICSEGAPDFKTYEKVTEMASAFLEDENQFNFEVVN